MTTTTLERELGVETIKKAIKAIEDSINASNGQFNVKMEVSTSALAWYFVLFVELVCQLTLVCLH